MNGKVQFAPIPKLPNNWWTDDLEKVWDVWDRNTYYLWGANQSNYLKNTIGEVIGGGGMAGTNGPTRGMAHPHYIGVNTMEFNFMSDNDAVFADLLTKIQNGKNVVIPIYPDDVTTPCMSKYSLGTGIGSNVSNWKGIQEYVFQKILELVITNANKTNNCEIPNGVYWPNCSQKEPYPRHMITTIDDINTILNNYLNTK